MAPTAARRAAGYSATALMACKAARDTGIAVVGVYDPFYAMYEAEMRQLCRRYIRSFTELL